MQQCTGYHAITSRFWWHKLLVLLLTPVEALMVDMAPDLAARLLVPCGLADADFVLVKVALLPDCSVRFEMDAAFVHTTAVLISYSHCIQSRWYMFT